MVVELLKLREGSLEIDGLESDEVNGLINYLDNRLASWWRQLSSWLTKLSSLLSNLH